jgi:hypothetical protein
MKVAQCSKGGTQLSKAQDMFAAIADYLCIAGDPTTATPEAQSGEDWVWNSERWKYSTAFPCSWSKPAKTGPRVLTPGVDVYSQAADGASTAIFCYAYHPIRDIDALTQELLLSHRRRGRVTKIEKVDSENNGIRHRTVKFRFTSERTRFWVQDQMMFASNMELVVSSVAREAAYKQCKEQFDRIAGRVKFNSNAEDVLPIREANQWKSVDWGYSVEFPKSWNDCIHSPDEKMPGVDVTCESWWGSSTAVFASPRNASNSIDEVADEVLGSYRRRARAFEVRASEDSQEGNLHRRTIEFEWISPDGESSVGHYSIMFAPYMILLVSSRAAEKCYTHDKKDFEAIATSVKLSNT